MYARARASLTSLRGRAWEAIRPADAPAASRLRTALEQAFAAVFPDADDKLKTAFTDHVLNSPELTPRRGASR